jgi:hypothetical protein
VRAIFPLNGAAGFGNTSCANTLGATAKPSESRLRLTDNFAMLFGFISCLVVCFLLFDFGAVTSQLRHQYFQFMSFNLEQSGRTVKILQALCRPHNLQN